MFITSMSWIEILQLSEYGAPSFLFFFCIGNSRNRLTTEKKKKKKMHSIGVIEKLSSATSIPPRSFPWAGQELQLQEGRHLGSDIQVQNKLHSFLGNVWEELTEFR